MPILSQPGVAAAPYPAFDIDAMILRLNTPNNVLPPPYTPGPPITEGMFSSIINEEVKSLITWDVEHHGYLFFISPENSGEVTIYNELNMEAPEWVSTTKDIDGKAHHIYYVPTPQRGYTYKYSFEFN